MSHARPASGCVGTPSNSTCVAAFSIGPARPRPDHKRSAKEAKSKGVGPPSNSSRNAAFQHRAATNPRPSAIIAKATHVSKGRAGPADSLCAHNIVTWQRLAHVQASACCCLVAFVQASARRIGAMGISLRGRAIGDVGVPRDPAAVGGAPVHVAEVVVEHVLERGGRADHVAAQRVLHALGLARGPAGVQLRALCRS